MSVLGLSVPITARHGVNGTGHGLLSGMIANPLEFGEPTFGPTMSLEAGVRTIPAGPPSPLPRSHGYSDLNGIAGPSTLPSSNLVSPSSTIRQLTTPITTPTRKGKKPASGDLPNPHSNLTASATKWNADGSPGKFLHPKVLDLSWPNHLEKVKRQAAGLINPSMACYANSTLQVVLHTPPVLKMITAHGKETLDEPCVQDRKGFCSLCALYDMAKKHWQQDRYSPKQFHSHLSHIKKGFSKNKQEDAHEFFRFLTDSLQATALAGQPKALPEKLKHTTWVHGIWGGIVRSRVVCGRCKKPSDTLDHFLDLSLDVNRGGGSPKLQTMLQGFTREEKLEGDNKYKCESCKSKANATKFFRIARAPPILTFHLKRFTVSYGFRGQPRADKYNQFISYPELLDLSPYMVKGQPGEHTYRLFAVTCHRGNELRFGHYTSYVKAPSGKWYHADDEDMTSCLVETVLQDRNAYLLSYIKVDSDAVPPRVSESPGMKTNGQFAPSGSSTLTNGTHRNGATSNGYTPDRTYRPSEIGHSGSRKRERSPDAPNGLSSRPAKRSSPPNGDRPATFIKPLPPLPPSDDPPPERSDPPEKPKEKPEFGTSVFTWESKKQKEKPITAWNGASMLGLDKERNKGFNKGFDKGSAKGSGKGPKDKKKGRGPPMPFAVGRKFKA